MLQQILALSRDPDAAELVQSGAQLAAAFEPLMMLSQEVTLQHEVNEVAPGLRGLMLIPLLMPLMLQQTTQSNGQRPLGERALNRLLKTVLDAAAIERLRRNDGEAVCAICYEEYVVGKRVLHLPCGHLFCVGCCLQWLRHNCTCPVCRSEVMDEENSDGGSDWHSEDLFPWRGLAQGSPLTAVRRARALQEGELWPPVDDMAAIAEQHSSFQSGQQEMPPSGTIREVWQSIRASEDIPTADENDRTQVASRSGPAPALSQESRASSPLRGSSSSMVTASWGDHEILSSERHDSPPLMLSSSSLAQEEAPDERSSRLQRRQQDVLANSPNARSNAQARSSPLRGQAQSLPRLAHTNQAASPLMRIPSRTASNGARGATNVRSAGTSTPVSRHADLRRRSGLQSNGLR